MSNRVEEMRKHLIEKGYTKGGGLVSAIQTTPTGEKHQSIEALKVAQAEAEKEAKKGVGKRFLGELYNNIVGTGAQFVASAVEAPYNIATKGKSTDKTYNLNKLGLQPFKSIQSEAKQQIQEGDSLQKTLLNKGTKTIVGGLDVIGIGKGTKALPKTLSKIKNSFKSGKKLLSETVEVTKPVLDKKASIGAFERTGMPGGVSKQGFMGTYKTTPTPRDVEVAQSLVGVVSPSKGPLDNIAAINQKITQISDTEIKPFLKANPAPFNVKTLDSRLRSIEPPDWIKSDETLRKAYDLTRQRMLDITKKYKKTTSGLWEARKEFDALAERQLGNLDPGSEKASTIKQAVLDTRREVNNFIADSTPNGDAMFKQKLKNLSNMYEGRGNIAERNYQLLNKNAVQRWARQNPGKVKFLTRYLIPGAGLLGGYKLID